MAKKIKAHSLTGRITPAVMEDAFRCVKRNRGAAGIDKVSIELFENNLDQNLLALMRCLKDGTYQSHPLRRVHIPKGDGNTRPLGIPAVRDRVAQEVVRQLLSPLFERIFHNDSYGFRPGRSCHMAVARVLELHQSGHDLVQQQLTQLGLALSPEKTKETRFRDGFAFRMSVTASGCR